MTSEEPPRRGLAIASVSVGAVALTLTVSTWIAWLLVRPGLERSPDYSWITAVFVLVLGALWFAMLPAGVLAMIFGLLGGARSHERGNLPAVGAMLGGLVFLAALAGAVVFTVASWHWGPPTVRLGDGHGLL